MEFRKTTAADLAAVCDIYAFAKSAFAKAGIPQWQGAYPNAATVEGDIAQGIGYVLCDGDEIVGAVALTTDGEEGYRYIFDGAWLTDIDAPYVTVHRIAVSGAHRGRGLSKRIMHEAYDLARQCGARSVRVDTHEQNAVMRAMLEGLGYTRCGRILLLDGDERGAPRLCYEKTI